MSILKEAMWDEPGIPPLPSAATVHPVAASHTMNFIVVSRTSDLHVSYLMPPKQPVGKIIMYTQTGDINQWVAIPSSITSNVPGQVIVPTTRPIDLFGLGVYYSLFFLTIVLIVTTLPKAIIAWKERG